MRLYFLCVFLGLGLTVEGVSAEWTNKVKVGGDLRYRHEMKTQEVVQTENDTRHRQRIRARVGVDGKVSHQVKVGIRVATGATGHQGGNISTNQSLDGNSSKKSFNLDLAYFEWALNPLFKVTGGKMKHQIYRPGKSELMFDDDLTPEGLSVSYVSCGSCPRSVFANVNVHWLDERFIQNDNRDQPDAIMYGGQLGVQLGTGLILGIGSYEFTSIQGKSALSKFAGNSLVAGEVYGSEFKIWQVFFETKVAVVSRALSFFADYARNSYPEDKAEAYLFGFKYGRAGDVGDVQVIYTYREVQADSVIGSLNDSDFIGGGTDGRGHEVKLKWGIAEGATLGLAYFANTKNIQKGTVPTDFNLAQLDFMFKF